MDISTKIIEKSAEFLKTTLKDARHDDFLLFFQNLLVSDLVELTDLEKKNLWINLYNAFVQIELMNMKDAVVDKSIFSKKLINVAGQKLSFDQIEHGILRGNLWKYGLGFLPRKYLNRQTQHWRTKKLDPRIHFQLNCGASSCPIIRILSIDNVKEELELGESDFVKGESIVYEKEDKILMSSLFLFYLKDFGGRSGLKALVKRYYPKENYTIGFKRFDWTKSPKRIK